MPRRNAAALMLKITLLRANDESMRAKGLWVVSRSAFFLEKSRFSITIGLLLALAKSAIRTAASPISALPWSVVLP